MGSHGLDWNRRGFQRLILDAEDEVSFLTNALAKSDPGERARAMRNGRLIYKELTRRRKNFLLTPVSAAASEQLLDEMISTIREAGDLVAEPEHRIQSIETAIGPQAPFAGRRVM